MKVISATAIGKLIEAHRNGDEEKFYIWANFIADVYEENDDMNAAKLIRNRINGVESAKAVLDGLTNTDSNTAWELATTLVVNDENREYNAAFDGMTAHEVMQKYSAQEALEKYRAYKKGKQ